MKKYFPLLVLTIFLALQCNNKSEETDIINQDNNIPYSSANQSLKLPVSYKKLENFLGSNFIPIFSLKKNLDTDSEDEIVIAYKETNISPIHIYVFGITKKDTLKKKFEFPTEIYNADSFLIQTQHLSSKNDICITIEGKSNDNKNKLYMLTYLDDDFKEIGNFSAFYSTIVNYEEIDDEKGKFTKIKDINLIDNDSNSTNPNIQKKETYKWDTATMGFQLTNTEEIFSTTISSIDQSILYSEEKYYDYLKGFWYPQKYKELIETDKLNPDDFLENDSRLIAISSLPKEISVKYGDYVGKFTVVKISKSWNQKPGIRLILKEFSNQNPKNDTSKFIDLTLLERNTLAVIGPEQFDNDIYVRLPKPFEEYINEKKMENLKKNIEAISTFLNGSFKTKDDVSISFDKTKNFFITKKGNTEKGYYKISGEKQGFIISLLYESTNSIIKNTNFIIKISEQTNSFSLIPIKFDFNGIIIEDLNSISFYKSP